LFCFRHFWLLVNYYTNIIAKWAIMVYRCFFATKVAILAMLLIF
jgi:hypothetical protein